MSLNPVPNHGAKAGGSGGFSVILPTLQSISNLKAEQARNQEREVERHLREEERKMQQGE